MSRFEAIFQRSLDGLYHLVPVRGSGGEVQEYCFARINEPAAKMLGAAAEEIVGKRLDDFLEAERVSALMERFETALNSGEALEFQEEVGLHPQPGYVHQQIIPLPEGILVQVRDISDSQRAQQALRDSEEYLSSVVANVPVIMYELDPEGVFKLSAGRSLSQIGLQTGEAVGSSILDYFPEESPEVQAFRRALKGETFTTQTTLGDGYFASRYTPRYDDDGKVVGVLGVSYDITEQRLAEEQLRRAQRLDAVGQLTGGIAHDFNNLLAVVLGNLDLLENLQSFDDKARSYIRNAVSATERGAMLTKRLLAFSRKQLLEPCITDTNDLIAGMLAMLGRTIPENIDIAFEPAEDQWPINIDPSQLEHAVLNLCVNARDAMPDGGRLSILTRNRSLSEEEAKTKKIATGNYVELSVKDTGCGIPEELQDMIFEPFYTTKDVGKGNGLGLSMVYGFIDQSGGAIDLASAPGEGTSVCLFLPTAEAQDDSEIREPQDLEIHEPGAGERILVVEDDAGVREFVSHALSAMNYEIIPARNGDLALNWLEQGEPLDLLFSDIVLPGEINGIELARRALALRPDLPVLLTTGYAKDANPVDLETLSHLEVIPKPYRTADLARKLRKLLDHQA